MAFFAYWDKEIDKTHSLIILSEKCIELNQSFEWVIEQVSFLNPYSTLYRYPMDELLPSEDETRLAIKYSSEVLDFVKKQIAAGKRFG